MCVIKNDHWIYILKIENWREREDETLARRFKLSFWSDLISKWYEHGHWTSRDTNHLYYTWQKPQLTLTTWDQQPNQLRNHSSVAMETLNLCCIRWKFGVVDLLRSISISILMIFILIRVDYCTARIKTIELILLRFQIEFVLVKLYCSVVCVHKNVWKN